MYGFHRVSTAAYPLVAKRTTSVVLALVFAVTLTSCTGESNKLTSAMVERALNKLELNASVKVLGIREYPEKNEAEVDFELEGYSFTYENSVSGFRQKLTHNGPASARFIRYNDGRWILKAVSFSHPGVRPYDNPRSIKVSSEIDTRDSAPRKNQNSASKVASIDRKNSADDPSGVSASPDVLKTNRTHLDRIHEETRKAYLGKWIAKEDKTEFLEFLSDGTCIIRGVRAGQQVTVKEKFTVVEPGRAMCGDGNPIDYSPPTFPPDSLVWYKGMKMEHPEQYFRARP